MGADRLFQAPYSYLVIGDQFYQLTVIALKNSAVLWWRIREATKKKALAQGQATSQTAGKIRLVTQHSHK